jgi:hypothetical protein
MKRSDTMDRTTQNVLETGDRTSGHLSEQGVTDVLYNAADMLRVVATAAHSHDDESVHGMVPILARCYADIYAVIETLRDQKDADLPVEWAQRGAFGFRL